ncbi:hypothetical protein Poly21_02390 [Allorhodopirellula heiligendammensis]|uniref:Uncharacterized protein n=1 Tax=Allorhodopirellula heiligendammensis TaxID=2714739 RepID=A0A5C6C452_9BACT|nr:hypothetical protein Poly21_02390 [Allorhodopirellula heiligendammensis]
MIAHGLSESLLHTHRETRIIILGELDTCDHFHDAVYFVGWVRA